MALARAMLAMVMAGFLAKRGMEGSKFRVLARPGEDQRGEYGGDLALLRRSYTPPEEPGESNGYFDLWSPGALPVLARVNGLTNNHTLFVDSHGKPGCSARGSGYGFYPNASLVPAGQKVPCYSARDLAHVMGPVQAAKIHNIVLACCNAEGRFRSAELRHHFPNATNITYMTPGQLAFKPMFYQAILYRSDEIRVLYGKPRQGKGGGTECEITRSPTAGAQALGYYIADLYLPAGRKPYRTVRAGRELLAPIEERKLDSPGGFP